MLRPREHPEEAAENHLKAVFGVLRRQVRDRRLRSDNELELTNEADDELAVWAQRLAQGIPPPAKLRLAFTEKRPHQAPESLCQGGVGDVAIVLVELTGREQAARWDERLVEFVHQRGLADAGIAGDEHELGCAIRHDPVESAEQRLDLVLPAIKLLRHDETFRGIVRAQRERLYAVMGLPVREALPQIDRETSGGLIPVLSGLGQELHYDRRERPWDARDPLVGRKRAAGNVAMHPFHRIGCGEGQFARQHLVEGHAQSVEIAAEIDRPIHPTRLFGGHVGECPGDHLRRRRGLALTWQTRGDAKAYEPDLAGDGVDQNIRRTDVLMDEAALVNLTKRRSDADGEAQKRRNLPRPSR